MSAERLREVNHETTSNLRVSRHSLWADNVWSLENPTAGTGLQRIDWGRKLAGETTLLDDEWSGFLYSCKRLVWLMLNEPSAGKPLKVGSLDSWIPYFWFAVDWMALAGYRHLGELDFDAIADYVEHLRQEKVFSVSSEQHITGHQLAKYLKVFTYFWREAGAMLASGAEALPEDPFDGKAATAVAGDIIALSWNDIPAVDDDTFIATVNSLEAWNSYKGEDIVRLFTRVLDLRSARSPRRLRSTRSRSELWDELRGFAFSQDPATGRPWHEPLEGTATNIRDTVRGLVTSLNMAGILSVQSTTGMRISEICGLDATPEHDGMLPSCIEVQSTQSGLFDIFFICGRLYKTTTEWVDTKWVAGLRPKGTDHLPPPVKAISLIARLFEPWRRASGVHSLFLTLPSGQGLPYQLDNLRRQRSQPLNQHDWIVQHVGINPAVKVTSHQWRKAFARFLFRSDKRLLPSISLHLQHVSLAMTESYVGNDVELLEDIDSEASHHASERLLEWATGSKAVKGPVAKMILDRCNTLGQRLDNYSVEEKKREIERIVEENGIRIWPLRRAEKNYAICIFRPGAALCRETQIGPVLRPDFAGANPGLCAGCSSMAVDESHIPYWAERLVKNEELFDQNRDSNIGVAMLAQKRVAQSRSVLSWFNPPPEDDVNG